MITSGGTNTGVMKLVGKAMKNYNLTRVEAKDDRINDRFNPGNQIANMMHMVSATMNVGALGRDARENVVLLEKLQKTKKMEKKIIRDQKKASIC